MALRGSRTPLADHDLAAEARRAARRAGLSLGEWLDAVVGGALAEDAAPVRRRDQRFDEPADRPGSRDAYDSVEHRLGRLVSAIGSNMPVSRDEAPDALRNIASRLERLGEGAARTAIDRGATRETVRDLEERLKSIARRMEESRRPTPPAPSHPAPAGAAAREPAGPASTEAAHQPAAGIAARGRALETDFDRLLADHADRIDHRLDTVAERLEQTLDEASPLPALRDLQREVRNLAAGLDLPGQDLADIRAMVGDIVHRFDQVPGRVAEDLAARFEDTLRRLDTATRAELDAIRGELREIAQDLDRNSRGEFESLRAEIARLAERIDAAPVPTPAGFEARLEDLAVRLDTAARGEFESIRAELRELGDKLTRDAAVQGLRDVPGAAAIEAIRAEMRDFAGSIDRSGRDEFESMRAEFRELSERLSRDQAAAAGPDGEAALAGLEAIRAEIRDLAGHIDRSGREGIDGLRAEFRELSDRLAREAADPDVAAGIAAADLEAVRAEIRGLAEQLDSARREDYAALRSDMEALGERLALAPAGRMGELEDRLASLAGQLAGAARDGDPEALAQIEKQITRLAENVDASSRSMAGLGDLERTIGDLFERIDAGRSEAMESARAAASDAVDRALASIAGGEPGPDVLGALREELVAQRAGAEEAARNNQESLQAIHETLKRVVDRLEDLEEEIDDVADGMRTPGRAAAHGRAGSPALPAIDLPDIELPGADLRDADLAGDELSGPDRPDGEPAATEHATQVAVAAPADDTGHAAVPERAATPLAASFEAAVDRAAAAGAAAEEPVDGAEAEETADVRAQGRVDLDPDDIVGRLDAVARSMGEDLAREDDTPIAPGTNRPKASFADTDAAAGSGARSDFVAAARRAAQAAMAEHAGEQSDVAAAPGSRFAGLGETYVKYRRPLLIGLIMILVVFGAWKAAGLLKSGLLSSSALDGSPAVAAARPAATGPAATGPVERLPVARAEPAAMPVAAATAVAAPAPAARPVDPNTPRKAGSEKGAGKAQSRLADQPLPSQPLASQPLAVQPTGSIPNPATVTVEPAGEGPLVEGSGSPRLPAGAGGQSGGLVPDLRFPERLRQSAIAGDPTAQFEIAARYVDGRGAPQDIVMAANWYREAAGRGLAPAQYRLGSLYEKGQGVARDLAMARMWYQRAAEQGNSRAMHNLGVLYADGVDGQPDYEKAALWFRQAAELGLADSQFNIAVLYARGLGVAADPGEAFRWFAIAADQGDLEALRKRDEIAADLDDQTLTRARTALDAWQPQPQDVAANVVAEPQGGWDETLAAVPLAASREMVAAAQDLLNRLGFSSGPADGEMGPRTRDAVRAFERSVGLPETGEITRELIEELGRSAG